MKKRLMVLLGLIAIATFFSISSVASEPNGNWIIMNGKRVGCGASGWQCYWGPPAV